MPKTISDLLTLSACSKEEKACFLNYLSNHPEIKSQIENYLKKPSSCSYTPLIIRKTDPELWLVFFPEYSENLEGIGLNNSVLAHVRNNNYDDSLLPSDCFGQLSCSSCAIEVLYGNPVNRMRDEEYDMLSIDKENPATAYSRLGCQTVVGKDLLIIRIR